ncbi:hypothetical protein BM1_02301 [Bipolaris maydis]|nr:hypothetical protein BM1_02301 [Bipolaris maydis]
MHIRIKGLWTGDHFKQLQLCEDDVDQDETTIISGQMFVIAHQILAHTHLAPSTLTVVPNSLVNPNGYLLGVFLSSLEKRLNLNRATA